MKAKNVVNVYVTPGFTSHRPNGQREVNAMIRYKYDECIRQFTNGGDFRNTDATISEFDVIRAIHFAVKWLRGHPEMVVAAWLKSGLVSEQQYHAEGYGDLAPCDTRGSAIPDTHTEDMRQFLHTNTIAMN